LSLVVGSLRRDIAPYIVEDELYAKSKTMNDVDAVDAVWFEWMLCVARGPENTTNSVA
jgi:hypothetical protein